MAQFFGCGAAGPVEIGSFAHLAQRLSRHAVWAGPREDVGLCEVLDQVSADATVALAFMAGIVVRFQTAPLVTTLDREWFWRHCARSARASAALIERAPQSFGLDPAIACAAAFAHDIGRLLLIEVEPERHAEAVRLSAAESIPLLRAERRIFEVSATDVTARLIYRWRMPAVFEGAALRQGADGGLDASRMMGVLVGAASALAHASDPIGGWIPDTSVGYSALQGFDVDDLDAMVEELRMVDTDW